LVSGWFHDNPAKPDGSGYSALHGAALRAHPPSKVKPLGFARPPLGGQAVDTEEPAYAEHGSARVTVTVWLRPAYGTDHSVDNAGQTAGNAGQIASNVSRNAGRVSYLQAKQVILPAKQVILQAEQVILQAE
jgi:hypothetical protein